MGYPADGANFGRRSSGCFLFGETGWQAGFVAAVLATGAVAFGCAGQQGQPAGELTPQEEKAIADTVTTIAENMSAAFEELEPEPYFEYYSDDFQMYIQGSLFPRAEWEKRTRKLMSGLQEVSEEVVKRNVEVLGPNAASVSHQVVAQASETDGEHRQTVFAVTYIFKRLDTGWKVISGHESFVPSEEDTE